MAKGHIEPLPSGSFRAVVYAGRDPITGKPTYLRETAKTEEGAVALLAKLLAAARVGRAPEAHATVGYLLDHYLASVDVEHSTRDTYDRYARRIIKPTLGGLELRKVRGRTLELLYARLRTCRDLCTGRAAAGHACRPGRGSTPVASAR